LTCPQLRSNQVDISQTQDGTVNCGVTGSGLGLISAINLQKADSKISGTIKATNDGNSATLQFKPDELCSGEGTYSLFVTYKSDTQKEAAPLDTGAQVALIKQPAISGSADLTGETLTLKGKCMDQIKQVSLVKDENDSSPLNGTDQKTSATQVTATIKGAKPGTNYHVRYTIAAQTEPIAPKSLTVTPAESTGASGAVSKPKSP
jgi:hypothetical protein